MLQRAASNAYSWWWASHIRTKQSKWLEQSLQDMEEKVTVVLKMIEEDGDSFAKRAEMYYKKRPELIHFVEESYRAFRALAERYDLMSKELQNANSTLASAFPDQFQYPIDDDEDGTHQVPRRGLKPSPNAPSVPKHFPTKKIKALMALTSNPGGKKPVKGSGPRSGMSKNEAIEEIDRLQKAILIKQTEKEFTKSSYETGLAKYWEIEEAITEMQQKVSKLQDEFSVSKEIDDNEARRLMLDSALKSCQETLAKLQEKQEKTVSEAREEKVKIKIARKKLMGFTGGVFGDRIEEGDFADLGFDEGKEVEMVRERNKERFEMDSSPSVSEMADRMDELVSKVINLEAAVSSQTASLQRLRVETEELQQYVQHLEDDKASLIDGKNSLDDKMREMEGKLKKLQELERSVERKNDHLRVQFSDASSDLDEISQKLPSVKLDDEETERTELALSTKEDPAMYNGISKELEYEKIASQELSSSQEKLEKINDISEEVKFEKDVSQEEVTMSSIQELVKKNDITEEVIYQQNASQEEVSSIQEEFVKINDISEEVMYEKDTPKFVPDVVEEMNYLSSVIQHEEAPRKESAEKFDVSDEVEAEVVEESRDLASSAVEEGSVIQQESDQSPPLKVKVKKEEDEPNWQQMFIEGLEGKEKVILNEYTTILRNYKEMKKKLGEVENKSGDSLTELKELQIQNAHKDDEIQSLRYKLIMLQQKSEEAKIKEDHSNVTERDDDDVISFVVEDPRKISAVEEKLRGDIDEILEENLNFWMRFSSSFSQVQKLQSEIEDLQKELAKIEKEKKKKKDGSGTPERTLNTDARPVYKHLKEIQTELTVWLEKSGELKDELKGRFSQLCRIQEDITRALSDGAVDEEMMFTSYQAAKFQGEVLNMQQENTKVEDELQAAVEHVSSLQMEVERTVSRLNEELGITGSRSGAASGSKNRIPLRAFIFGSKMKKPKQSLLSGMHPSWHRKY